MIFSIVNLAEGERGAVDSEWLEWQHFGIALGGMDSGEGGRNYRSLDGILNSHVVMVGREEGQESKTVNGRWCG